MKDSEKRDLAIVFFLKNNYNLAARLNKSFNSLRGTDSKYLGDLTNYLKISYSLCSQGFYHSATYIVNSLTKYSINNYELIKLKGILFEKKKDYKNAIHCFSILTTMQDHNPDPYILKSRATTLAEGLDNSIIFLKSVLRYFPHASIRQELAFKYLQCFDYELALGHYNFLHQKSHESDINYLLGLSHCYLGLKRYQTALRYFLSCHKLDPKNIDILFNIAYCLSSIGCLTKARYFLICALALDPAHARSITLFYLNGLKVAKETIVSDFTKLLQKSYIHNNSGINLLHFIFLSLFRITISSNNSFSGQHIQTILALHNKSHIVAFGDSHVNIFRNLKCTNVFYVGSSTIYSLNTFSSRNYTLSKILYQLKNFKPDDNILLFCFGEIDFRVHFYKHANLKDTVEDNLDAIFKSYVTFLSKFEELGYTLYVFLGYGIGNDRSTRGDKTFINKAYHKFIQNFSHYCHTKLKRTIVFSIHHAFSNVLDDFNTDQFTNDSLHLSDDTENKSKELTAIISSSMHQSTINWFKLKAGSRLDTRKFYKACFNLFANNSRIAAFHLQLSKAISIPSECFDLTIDFSTIQEGITAVFSLAKVDSISNSQEYNFQIIMDGSIYPEIECDVLSKERYTLISFKYFGSFRFITLKSKYRLSLGHKNLSFLFSQ